MLAAIWKKIQWAASGESNRAYLSDEQGFLYLPKDLVSKVMPYSENDGVRELRDIVVVGFASQSPAIGKKRRQVAVESPIK